jgi:hypothetical protein
MVELTWVRIASSVLSARNYFPFNRPHTESALEAMRTEVFHCFRVSLAT